MRYFSEQTLPLVTASSHNNEGQVTTPELMSARSEHLPEREKRKATTQGDVTRPQ